MNEWVAYLHGLVICAGLIIAIGAQNALVLVQAIRREYHFQMAGFCALLDALLISLGVLGVGTLVASSLPLRLAAGIGGVCFLTWFGYTSLRSAINPQGMELCGEQSAPRPRKKVFLQLLAVTLLNPHVYIDTVVLVGGISGQYPGVGRYFFGLGAITASLVWFFLLAFAGSALAPFFRRPVAWQILYGIVCLMVWAVALGLVMVVWQDMQLFFSATT